MTVDGATDPELILLADADRRAQHYAAGIQGRRVFPDAAAIAALEQFDEALPLVGAPAVETLRLLDEVGSPATVASNGPRYFGFVTGATLPVAAAADRLVLAWDQGALMHLTSPAAARIEAQAAQWLLDVLDLPRESGVGFTTSATAGTLIALAAARRAILRRAGWDVDEVGTAGAPRVRIVTSELVHVVVKKAVRVLGFGLGNVEFVPVDQFGRLNVEQLPELDENTIVVLQAGEVNTGDFDPFVPVIAAARKAGAWVHVDGAFGLWARASSRRELTEGVDGADSWTTDGHKWLNTPYDSAMVIVRDRDALAGAMNSDAAYSSASADSQKNLTLEFSRRARGVAIWAALRTLGSDGVRTLVDSTSDLAQAIASGLREEGFDVLNRVVINQVLARGATEEETARVVHAVQDSGEYWFGGSVWQQQAAFRVSVSSWRTTEADARGLVRAISRAR
ncbi:aspartate aminotransferase family protein [Curtobacterium sp. MCBD17_034]|uniref:pyridoxal phosphate-dependent decarboxylase family protein n=1 Tax=unclassified Curtobacterium TaxID=257496 RepID=UPI000DA80B03|nr:MULTISPECIES: aminotransferase class V-fold PLP-dependent enzyme [unclassified Curtobacterium]PZF62109.1 aspartate aminotransferase family protein [Curtobacterium sp. MCBD17_034]PZM33956.1 aspartate aminotransferase family protein [Curtobacterium sp. MCBD17_031]